MILYFKPTKFIYDLASIFSSSYITPTFIAIFDVPLQKCHDLRSQPFISDLLYS